MKWNSEAYFSPSIWAGHDAQGCEGRDAEYMASRRPQGKEWTKMVNDIDILIFTLLNTLLDPYVTTSAAP